MSKTDSTPTTRRAFVQRSATALAVGAAVPAVIIPRAAQGTEPDPIFAMIEAHKAAVQRDTEAIKAVCTTPNADAEAYEAAEDRRSETREDAYELQVALLTTAPTSMAGVVAVLRHAMTGQYGEVYFDDGHASTVLGDLYASNNEELIEIAQNFLPMIADTITQLTSTS